MIGSRAFFVRTVLTVLFAAIGTLLVLTAGCGSDDSNVTYPDRPAPELGIWFLGVWGTGPDDVYVVGQPGLIYHWDGATWTRQESGTTAALTDVWGDGSGTIYITGHDGVILRSQGNGSWSRMDYDSAIDLFAVGRYQGQIYVCGRSEDFGQLSVLSGGTWNPAPAEIFQRDAEQAVIDTLYLREDDDPDEIIESLTSIAHHGVTGADGVILMVDPETDWQLRRITGGNEWVTCSTSSDDRVSGNFIATDGGRLYQLVQLEGDVLAWAERFSPSFGETVYGIHTGDADTIWAAAEDGTINRIDPDNSYHPLYDDGLIFFDIWGSSGTDLYAVGIEGRVLHFTDVGGEFQWVHEELPLPETTKRHAEMVFDKFGRYLD